MSVDVADSSSFDSLFNTPQNDSHGNDADLSAIAEFNAIYGNDGNASIDPRQTMSQPASPASAPSPFNPGAVDQTFSPESSYPDIGSAPTSPYFQSIELQQTFQPSPLRHQYLANQHRRSVSEPPDGFMHHHQPQPPVVFHRDGHMLGMPTKKHPYPQALKSLPKAKHPRAQPYSRPGQSGQGRYELRRTQTQPVRGPTSAPQRIVHPPMQQHPMMRPPQQPFMGMPFEPIPEEQPHFISSRVCTPGPTTPPMVGSPTNIDPRLTSPTPAQRSGVPTGHATVVRLSPEELRAMIEHTVRKAIESIEREKAQAHASHSTVATNSAAGAEGNTNFKKATAVAEDEDTIVIAQSIEHRDGNAMDAAEEPEFDFDKEIEDAFKSVETAM